MPPRRESTPRSPTHAAFGEAVRRLREERKLTQEQLAEMLRTDIGQIGGTERGTGNPTVETQRRVAEALGLDLWRDVAALAGRLQGEDVSG